MIEKKTAIQEILEQRGSTLLLISAKDLKETIRETVYETKRSIESDIVRSNGVFLLTINEVMERLSISRKTLYNWVHKKYLIPIEIGGKKRFKLSDVNAILNNSNNSTINKYEND